MTHKSDIQEERLKGDDWEPSRNNAPPVMRYWFTLALTCHQQDRAFMDLVFDGVMNGLGYRHQTDDHISYLLRMDDRFYKRVPNSLDFQRSMALLCAVWLENAPEHRGIDIEMHMPNDADVFRAQEEKTDSPHLMYLTIQQRPEDLPIDARRFEWLAKGFDEGKEFLHQLRTCCAADIEAPVKDPQFS